LSTLATTVAEFGDGDCCRIRQQSPKSATVAEFGNRPNSATVAEFGDKLSPEKLSPFPATIVAEIGDYSLQCGQGFIHWITHRTCLRRSGYVSVSHATLLPLPINRPVTVE